ncbi:MAG: prepilin-type N-terminal cleavage/methylation domain-containing protein [Thermoleophilia bacterium]|nr:prepilin-type N-terminal cleavage/methylation domain-containing protein [Thermoleophilia bacterium]
MSTFRSNNGFTLIELLIGLVVTVVLVGAAGLLFLAVTKRASAESDAMVGYLQGRVAVARLERDLRLATAHGCRFATAGPILEAGPSQLVFLRREANSETPIIVEWEIASGSLMRRWGLCPSFRPKTFAHSLYRDNKTMLHDVAQPSRLAYVLEDGSTREQVLQSAMSLIRAVTLHLRMTDNDLVALVSVATEAPVGR